MVNIDKATVETALESVFDRIKDNNIALFVKRVKQGQITKEQARDRLRHFLGDDVALPAELLDDDAKLPHDAEFVV